MAKVCTTLNLGYCNTCDILKVRIADAALHRVNSPLIEHDKMVSRREARQASQTVPTPEEKVITKKVGGEKNGGERKKVIKKGGGWYPADDVKTPVPSRKHNHKPTKLRKKITPGTVLILLAGVYRGMRVVFLKQLPSGLLLVTGPYSVNGIPLRRVNQRFVIATSAKVDIGGVDVAKFDDAYFKRSKKKGISKKKNKEEFFEEGDGGSAKKELTEEKKNDQKTVDKALIGSIAEVPYMKSYLSSKFTLSNGQYPHEMKF